MICKTMALSLQFVAVLLINCGNCLTQIEKIINRCSNGVECPAAVGNVSVGTKWLHSGCRPTDLSTKNATCFLLSDRYQADQHSCQPAQDTLPGTLVPFASSYWMTDHCPNRDVGGVPCQELASHSSRINPVSSKSSGRIYINQECAQCHNVSEITSWDVVLLCRRKLFKYSSFTPDVWASITGTSGPCDVWFLPPEGQEARSSKCLQSMMVIDPCNSTDHWDSLMSNIGSIYQNLSEAIVDIDTDTRWGRVVYGNTYCLVCRDSSGLQNLQPRIDCSLQQTVAPLQAMFLYSFIMDPTVYSRLTDTMARTGKTSVDVCLQLTREDKERNRCRRIACPEAQARDEFGECRLYVASYILGKMYIALTIQPPEGTDIETSALEGLTEQQKVNARDWLRLPYFDEDWKFRIQYEVPLINGQPSSKISALKVFMVLESPRIDALKLYSSVLKTIASPCTVVVGGRTFQGKVGLSSGRLSDGHRLFDLSSTVSLRSAVLLSKMYFCHQAELHSHEYEKIGTSRIKVKGKKLFDDEFILQTDNGTDTIRICTNDLLDTNENTFSSLFPTDSSTVPIPGSSSMGSAASIGASVGLLALGVLVVGIAKCYKYRQKRSQVVEERLEIELQERG